MYNSLKIKARRDIKTPQQEVKLMKPNLKLLTREDEFVIDEYHNFFIHRSPVTLFYIKILPLKIKCTIFTRARIKTDLLETDLSLNL